jgi:hypothetical protein
VAELTKEERVLLYASPRAIAGFFSSVQAPSGADDCALWLGATNNWGYGIRTIYVPAEGRDLGCKAHRLMYAYAYGPIPAGLQLDHLCRVRRCVHPGHLEPVTGRENKLRSPLSVNAINAAKTECGAGHPFDKGSTYVCPTTGKRTCRVCRRENNRRRYRERQGAAMAP